MALGIVFYTLCVMGIIVKKSRFLTVMMLAVMWVVFALCTYNGDFDNYAWIYQNIENHSYWMEYEPLFNVFMYLCHRIGLSFIQFRMLYATVYMILLYFVTTRYTDNVAETLGLFMVFPFIYFTSVIRSGLATLLIVLAYYHVIDGRNNRLRFWMILCVATLFHKTSILFGVYYFLREKPFRKYIVISVVLFVLLAFGVYYSGILYRLASMVTSNFRTLKWFMPDRADQKIRWTLYLFTISAAVIFMGYLGKNGNTYYIGKDTAKPNVPLCIVSSDGLFRATQGLNMMLLLFSPSFFMSNASGRFIWQMIPFNILCYAKRDEYLTHGGRRNRLTISSRTLLLVVFLIGLFVYSNLPYRGTENDAFMIFRYNLLYTR